MVSGTVAPCPAVTRLTKNVNVAVPLGEVTVNGPGSAVWVSASTVAFAPAPNLIDQIRLPGADGMLAAVTVTFSRPGRSGVTCTWTSGRATQSLPVGADAAMLACTAVSG